ALRPIFASARAVGSGASVHAIAMWCSFPSRTIASTPSPASPPAPTSIFPAPHAAGTIFPSYFGRWLSCGFCSCCLAARARGDFILPVIQLGDQDHAPMARLDDELAEAVEPGVALVEVGIDLLHHLLEPVGAHHIAVADHLRNRLPGELPRIPLSRGSVDFLGETR